MKAPCPPQALRAHGVLVLAGSHGTQPLGKSKSLAGPPFGSAEQRISGGWCSQGGAEASREQREEPTTGPRGQLLACLVLLPVMLEPPPVLVAHRHFNTCSGHSSCAGAFFFLYNKLMRYGVGALPHVCMHEAREVWLFAVCESSCPGSWAYM
jgi:hypothetical protein